MGFFKHPLFLQVLLVCAFTQGAAAFAGDCFDASKSAVSRSERSVEDHTIDRGLLTHAEHISDVILAHGAAGDARFLEHYRTLIEDLVEQIRKGSLQRVNEKIDGSPAIALGFSPEGKPFVAYKRELDPARKKKQQLVLSPADADLFYAKTDGLKSLFSGISPEFNSALKGVQARFKNYVFQGDLLFSPGSDRITKEAGKITIRSNTVTYEISANDPLFKSLDQAQVGIVVHTVGKKISGPDGRVLVEPVPSHLKEKLIEDFVADLQSKNVFAIHPWRNDVALPSAKGFPKEVAAKIRELLGRIEARTSVLSVGFKTGWGKLHEAQFRVYFNSGLRPPNSGGIYLDASKDLPYRFPNWIDGYYKWLDSKRIPGLSEKKLKELEHYRKEFDTFLLSYTRELEYLLGAYYDAIRIQYLLLPYMKEAQQSKLGGGTVEGLMLQTDQMIVKWVDRLEFTLQNNIRWARGSTAPGILPGSSELANQFSEMPEPLNQWRPGSVFLVMKGHPVHAGHIAMIRKTIEESNRRDVFILLSDKGPNLNAATWKEFGAAERKKDLQDKNYTYVFGAELRAKILRAALGPNAKVFPISTARLWKDYLPVAKAQNLPGKIVLAVGKKEIDAGRYDTQISEFGNQLSLLPIAEQEGGLSGTQVREALKAIHYGSPKEAASARKLLESSMSGIQDESTRKALIEEILAEWKKVDETAVKLLKPPGLDVGKTMIESKQTWKKLSEEEREAVLKALQNDDDYSGRELTEIEKKEYGLGSKTTAETLKTKIPVKKERDFVTKLVANLRHADDVDPGNYGDGLETVGDPKMTIVLYQLKDGTLIGSETILFQKGVQKSEDGDVESDDISWKKYQLYDETGSEIGRETDWEWID